MMIKALEQAAQESGGVLGGVQETYGCGNEQQVSGHGGNGLNLVVFSNLNDSVILFYDSMKSCSDPQQPVPRQKYKPWTVCV